ncbi:helix-turn-helix domain-containing protein [Mycobacterium sp. 1245852.3]|uniref:helix-turn-helix domain-containing protein n=1 Tax=Mycobacterium sp. 1245852.3 TaxID=1856860 RepID=UPI00080255E3|nr:hypothetical protein A9W96_19980 [Mycobacterium sp. 1245852.3]
MASYVNPLNEKQSKANSALIDENRLLSVKDAAGFLGVPHGTLRRWIAEGTVPAQRIGTAQRMIRLRAGDLARAARGEAVAT